MIFGYSFGSFSTQPTKYVVSIKDGALDLRNKIFAYADNVLKDYDFSVDGFMRIMTYKSDIEKVFKYCGIGAGTVLCIVGVPDVTSGLRAFAKKKRR